MRVKPPTPSHSRSASGCVTYIVGRYHQWLRPCAFTEPAGVFATTLCFGLTIVSPSSTCVPSSSVIAAGFS